MSSDIKKALVIGGMLGVLQGLLIFIGGMIACADRNKDVIFKSYCSLMVMNGRIHFISGSVSRISEIAVHQIAYALLIRQIEVGSRDSITFVQLKYSRMKSTGMLAL